jgi:penicillin-binding protein 2
VDNPQYRSVRKGLTKWDEYMNAFGYGHRLGVDIPSEDGGNIPDTTDYDKEYRGQWNSCTMVTIGIGQDKITVTPLQIANAMCIVANKGYYYIPHFVKNIENESPEDTSLLSKFRKKHEVLTHISDDVYNIVIDGMHGVTTEGTAGRIPKIPGIDVCAKTGTAENYGIINGQRKQLKDHSLFSCFAPMQNPKIAIAIIVENGGFGATWAGPMAYLMLEKYLNDTLRKDRLLEVDRIAAANLMPSWLTVQQLREDSIRAFQWFKMTKDSSYIQKYIFLNNPNSQPVRERHKELRKEEYAVLENKKPVNKISGK